MKKKHKKQKNRMSNVNRYDWSKPSQSANTMTNTTPVVKDDERSEIKDVDMLGFLKFTTKETWKRTESKHEYTWTGPKIPSDKWREVQAFFRFVNNTHKSEAVCRIYLNSRLNTWAFWAYPQEIKPGLEALELDGGDARQEQRAQFKPSEGWEAFGSIHSHCDAGAFQSGTDRKDESTNDGIHATLGKVSSSNMDMHWRISIDGHSFNISDVVDLWNMELGALDPTKLPPGMLIKIVEYDMCRAPLADQTFPEQWKENLIPKQQAPVTYHVPGAGSVTYQQGSSYQTKDGSKVYIPTGGGGSMAPGSMKGYYGGYGQSGSVKTSADDPGGFLTLEEVAKELIEIEETFAPKDDIMGKMMEMMEIRGVLSELIDLASRENISSTQMTDAWELVEELVVEKNIEQQIKKDNDMIGGGTDEYKFGDL